MPARPCRPAVRASSRPRPRSRPHARTGTTPPRAYGRFPVSSRLHARTGTTPLRAYGRFPTPNTPTTGPKRPAPENKKGETHPVSPEHKKNRPPKTPTRKTNKQKKRGDTSCLPQKNKRRRATLPHPIECSTITVQGLSYRVRKGTGRLTLAMTAAKPYPTHPPKKEARLSGPWRSGNRKADANVLVTSSHDHTECSVPSSANA